RLQLNGSSKKTDNPEVIHNHSSPEAKIALFLTLFKGREDVFAKRWQNKTGRSGYAPVCLNEWDRALCQKPQIKCSACKNQNFAQWDARTVDGHLRGIEVLGIYPLLNDETCCFLAIDFDGPGWEDDCSAIRKTCNENNIPVAIERSRSGNGAHVWFFFVENIDAVVARKFGSALLTSAMAKRHQIHFKSYDRLFPNQDTLPQGGFGNLIALPLQKLAREEGNSVFIDENFQPYDDQWRFLSTAHKFSESEIHAKMLELCKGNELGDLRQDEDEESKPWVKNDRSHAVTRSDVPEKVQITKANMLYVHKNGFSERALNALKRLAAFKNPAFCKAQAMRLSTWNKPRIISLSDESANYLYLPRGFEAELTALLDPFAVEIEWLDERCQGMPIEVEFNGQLREEQAATVIALLKYENGVLSASTAFGKTVIAARLIAERKVNTLVLVHTRQLLEQWQDRLTQFLTIEPTPVDNANPARVVNPGRVRPDSSIGQIGSGKNSPNSLIDVAVMQSLVRGQEVKDVVKNYGMVIVDECHHVPAFSFEQILRHVSAKYVYGLTATPARQDGHHPIIFMQCGPIRYKVDAQEQARSRPFDHYIIPRFTSFRKPLHKDDKNWLISEIYAEICADHIRNQLIIDDVLQCVQDGRHPIILTQRTAHVEMLATALRHVVPEVITLTGSMPAKERRMALETLSGLPYESNAVIVATGKFVGEGFDEPRLDTLFLAMPVAWKGTVQQYAGRLHRLYQGKVEVQVYDYVDVHVGVLEKMYQKRLRGYAAMGYAVKADINAPEAISSIFDNTNFYSVFHRDVQSARHEIVIVSPFLRKKRQAQMLSLVATTIQCGVKVTIVTRPESDFQATTRNAHREQLEYVKSVGATLVLKSRIHQKFAVIDRRTVWYGSMNLLSYGRSEESMMRLESVNIAHELLGILA
ncbi:MAG: DEAD/DEAH box helicase family protein, partial [bacterium]